MRWLLLPLLFIISTANAAIPVLALNEKNEFITGEISEEDYSKVLTIMKQTLDEKVVSGITAREGFDWKLSKFTLGLGLTGEIGIGPYKFSNTLKQRFVYSR